MKYSGAFLRKKQPSSISKELLKTLGRAVKNMKKLSPRGFKSQVNEVHARVVILDKFIKFGKPLNTQVVI